MKLTYILRISHLIVSQPEVIEHLPIDVFDDALKELLCIW